MRIRTGGRHAHREDTIDLLAEFYGRNRTESPMRAPDDVSALVPAIHRVPERDNLTQAKGRELGEQLSKRHFEFSFAIENGEIVVSTEAE